MNSVNLLGRLTADPETRTTSGGADMATFTLAVDDPFKKKDAEDRTSFFRCTAWRKTAELVTQYCGKGQQLGVTGRLEQRRWEDDSGQKRSMVQIVVDNVTFVGKREDKAGGQRDETPPPENAIEDDLPF